MWAGILFQSICKALRRSCKLLTVRLDLTLLLLAVCVFFFILTLAAHWRVVSFKEIQNNNIIILVKRINWISQKMISRMIIHVFHPWIYRKSSSKEFTLSFAFEYIMVVLWNTDRTYTIKIESWFLHAQLCLARKNLQLLVIWDLLTGKISCSAEFKAELHFTRHQNGPKENKLNNNNNNNNNNNKNIHTHTHKVAAQSMHMDSFFRQQFLFCRGKL